MTDLENQLKMASDSFVNISSIGHEFNLHLLKIQ